MTLRPLFLFTFTGALAITALACSDTPIDATTPDAATPDAAATAADAAADDPCAPPGAATVDVVFPPPTGATSVDTLTIRGHADDDGAVAAVRVNGALVNTDNGFADWQLEVPLQFGDNAFVIETEDDVGNVRCRAAERAIHRFGVSGWSPYRADIDRTGHRLFVLGYRSEQVVRVDTDTGWFSPITDAGHGAGPALSDPNDIAYDSAQDRVIVLTGAEPASLVAIDIATGDRTEIAGPSVGAGPALDRGRRLTLDAPGQRAWVTTTSPTGAQAMHVDLVTGARTLVASAPANNDHTLAQAHDLAYDPMHQRVIGVLWAGSLIAHDIATGAVSTLSDDSVGSGPSLGYTSAVAVGPDAGDLWVHGRSQDVPPEYRVMRVDPTTGDRALVSAPSPAPFYLDADSDLVVDDTYDRVLLTSRWSESVIATDRTNGHRSRLAGLAVGRGPALPYGSLVWDVDDAADMDRVLVTGYLDASIATLDVHTGLRSTVFDGTSATGPVFARVTDTVLDKQENRVLAVAREPEQSVFSIDLDTGERRLISGGDVGAGSELLGVDNIAWSRAQPDRVIVAGHRPHPIIESEIGIVTAVDVDTGARTLIAENHIGTGWKLQQPVDLALSVDGARALVLDEGGQDEVTPNALVEIDVTTRERRLVTRWRDHDGPVLEGYDALYWDESGGRAVLVGDERSDGSPALIEVNMETGERTSLISSHWSLPTRLRGPRGFQRHPVDAVMWVLDGSAAESLLAIDRSTGERVLVTR